MSADNTIKTSILIYLSYATESLEGLIQSVNEVFEEGDDHEIILLDDGTGSGKELADQWTGRTVPLRVVRFGKSFGESVAVDAGLELARGEMIITLPAGRPVTVESIRTLANGLEHGADLKIGYRCDHWTGWFDRAQMKVFYWLTHRATGARFKDLSSGVRAFRREVMEDIALYGDMIRFLPILAVGRGYQVEEFPIENAPTPAITSNGGTAGRKKATGLHKPATYINRLLDVLTLFFLLRFTRKPLRFFGALGSTLLIPGLMIDLFLLFQKIVTHESLAGRPMLLLGILLTVLGVQTISIGLIGEMIIFTHSREIRDFSIQEVLD